MCGTKGTLKRWVSKFKIITDVIILQQKNSHQLISTAQSSNFWGQRIDNISWITRRGLLNIFAFIPWFILFGLIIVNLSINSSGWARGIRLSIPWLSSERNFKRNNLFYKKQSVNSPFPEEWLRSSFSSETTQPTKTERRLGGAVKSYCQPTSYERSHQLPFPVQHSKLRCYARARKQ